MRARCAQRRGLGWAGLPVFRLGGVLCFSARCGRPLKLSEVAIDDPVQLRDSQASSQRTALQGGSDARRR
jgi:hypothetical protein